MVGPWLHEHYVDMEFLFVDLHMMICGTALQVGLMCLMVQCNTGFIPTSVCLAFQPVTGQDLDQCAFHPAAVPEDDLQTANFLPN